MAAKLDRVNVMGVGVSAISMEMALTQIDHWIRHERLPHYVTVTGVHGIMESQRDETIRSIHNAAGMVTPDGMPLVWLGKLAGYPHVERVYGPDLLLAVIERSLIHGYRHFFYGGAEGIPEMLRQKLEAKFPGVHIVGTYSPPFRPLTPEEDAQIVELINAAQPDIVWVGLSTPKQERWMSEHMNRVNAPVMIGIGAAFDYHAGVKAQAPRFIQRSGFEWLYRLAMEPRRLWKRYLINNPLFILGILSQKLGLRRYEL